MDLAEMGAKLKAINSKNRNEQLSKFMTNYGSNFGNDQEFGKYFMKVIEDNGLDPSMVSPEVQELLAATIAPIREEAQALLDKFNSDKETANNLQKSVDSLANSLDTLVGKTNAAQGDLPDEQADNSLNTAGEPQMAIEDIAPMQPPQMPPQMPAQDMGMGMPQPAAQPDMSMPEAQPDMGMQQPALMTQDAVSDRRRKVILQSKNNSKRSSKPSGTRLNSAFINACKGGW